MTDALINRRATNAVACALRDVAQTTINEIERRLGAPRSEAAQIGDLARCDDSTLRDIGLRRSDVENASATHREDPWTLLRFWQS